MNKIIKNQYPAQPLILKQDRNEPFLNNLRKMKINTEIMLEIY